MRIAIFDMDGTLANVDHRRHYVERKAGESRDFESFYEAMKADTLNHDVANVLAALLNDGWHIIICTGRPQNYQEMTHVWLKTYGVDYHGLMMRRDDEKYRKDCYVKQDMLVQIKREHGDKITEIIAFDDRDQVVDMWRANGVRCFQVAPGAF